MSEALERELDYLAHLVMREGGRIPGGLRHRILEFTEMLFRESRTAETHHYVMRLRDAIDRGQPELIYDSLHKLRSVVRASRYHEIERFTQQRVSQLETEVERLRKQLQVEQPEEPDDEQENMVKKFNGSKNRVFVIMPFSPDFDDVWTGGIKRACQDNGCAPLRVDQVSLSSWITDDVEEFIRKSTTVIVDVTGNNPNVMFELGYALARGKDPIIIWQPQDSEKLPFDISGIRHLDYEDSWQGIEQLAKDLKKYLLMTLDKQKKRKVRKKSSPPTGGKGGATGS